jgi:hypothetical protein
MDKVVQEMLEIQGQQEMEILETLVLAAVVVAAVVLPLFQVQ